MIRRVLLEDVDIDGGIEYLKHKPIDCILSSDLPPPTVRKAEAETQTEGGVIVDSENALAVQKDCIMKFALKNEPLPPKEIVLFNSSLVLLEDVVDLINDFKVSCNKKRREQLISLLVDKVAELQYLLNQQAFLAQELVRTYQTAIKMLLTQRAAQDTG